MEICDRYLRMFTTPEDKVLDLRSFAEALVEQDSYSVTQK